MQGAPMIAVEVVSRGNTAEETEGKVAAYLDGGATEVWIVYPRTRCMLVHKRDGIERVTETYKSEGVALRDILPGA